MGEISINPKFNIHETYKKVRILNPYRNATPSGGTMPRQASLIRFYKLNETTGDAIDETGIQNAVLYNAIVRDGSSYKGDGSSAYLDAGYTSETTKYTIATRITTSSATNVQFIASKFISSSNRSIYFYTSSGSLIFQTSNASVVYNNLTPDTTYDIVITCNNETSGTIKMYISKVLELTTATTGGTATNIPLNLFRRNNNQYYGNMKIDYFALWDIELTQSEINTIPEGSI